MRYFWVGTLLLVASCARAQTTAVADSTRPGSYCRLDWENDGFQLRSKNISDRYYTNGIRLTLGSNAFRTWPTRHALLTFSALPDRTYGRQYDLSVGQEIYTPRNLTIRDRPLYPTDQPYAGYLYLKWGLVTTDATAGRKMTSNLVLGVIGPLSGAAEVQSTLHDARNYPRPLGWGTQMPNDPAISYYIKYEARAIPQFTPVFDVIGQVEGNIGTLSNYAGMGTQLRIGLFNDYFQNATGLYSPPVGRSKYPRRNVQFYAFLGTSFRAVLDNSLLQGGWLSGKTNFYALPAVEMKHFIGLIDFGGAIVVKNFQFTFTQSLQTPAFIAGLDHQYGHLSLLFRCGK